jgi:cell division protein FtsL
LNNYYAGTSAYKLEQYEAYTRKATRVSDSRKSTSKAQQLALCKIILALVVALFVASSSLIYVNVMKLRAMTEIDGLEKELALIVDRNKQTEIEINQNRDLKVIKQKAIEKLGMQKLDNSQIVYINVKKGGYSEAVGSKVASAEKIGGVKKLLMGIKEYFS